MATLLARLAQGDPAAFDELYDAYSRRVGHYLLVRIGSRHDADGVLQETFCRQVSERVASSKNEMLSSVAIRPKRGGKGICGKGK
jgi:DNA-directed RNA polymerase specialized sigma24 family protein